MNRRVLVVDDDQDIRRMVEKILGTAGYAVSVAKDGQSGLTLAKAERPDLILLDVMMPGIDGMAVLAEFRRTKELAHTKVIMLTAKSQPSDKAASARVGADLHVIKPFTYRQLLHAVESLCPKP
jgi:DNA-binding response OmpR family regulator